MKVTRVGFKVTALGLCVGNMLPVDGAVAQSPDPFAGLRGGMEVCVREGNAAGPKGNSGRACGTIVMLNSFPYTRPPKYQLEIVVGKVILGESIGPNDLPSNACTGEMTPAELTDHFNRLKTPTVRIPVECVTGTVLSTQAPVQPKGRDGIIGAACFFGGYAGWSDRGYTARVTGVNPDGTFQVTVEAGSVPFFAGRSASECSEFRDVRALRPGEKLKLPGSCASHCTPVQ